MADGAALAGVTVREPLAGRDPPADIDTLLAA